MANNERKREKREAWEGHYGTHAGMVAQDVGDGRVIARDGSGYYLTEKSAVDNGLVDFNRNGRKWKTIQSIRENYNIPVPELKKTEEEDAEKLKASLNGTNNPPAETVVPEVAKEQPKEPAVEVEVKDEAPPVSNGPDKDVTPPPPATEVVAKEVPNTKLLKELNESGYQVNPEELENSHEGVCSCCQTTHGIHVVDGAVRMNCHNINGTDIQCEGGGSVPQALVKKELVVDTNKVEAVPPVEEVKAVPEQSIKEETAPVVEQDIKAEPVPSPAI